MRKTPSKTGEKSGEVKEEDAIFVPSPFDGGGRACLPVGRGGGECPNRVPPHLSSPTEGRGGILWDYFLDNYRGEGAFDFL